MADARTRSAVDRSGPSSVIGPRDSDARTTIHALVDGSDSRVTATAAERAALRALYERHGYAPVWMTAAGEPTSAARDALQLLSRAGDDGLNPADYSVPPADDGDGEGVGPIGAGGAAAFDVGLSAGVLRFLQHVHRGRVDPRVVGFRLGARGLEPQLAAILDEAIANSRVSALVRQLRPHFAQYGALQAMLARYRALDADSTLLVEIPAVTRSVHVGEPYAIGALYRRLQAFGDLPSDTPAPPESGRYDGALAAGVKRFQARHGLTRDGVLGRGTVEALRVPMATRVHQIEFALERLRWLPDPGNGPLIVLNIPMFRLWAWDAVPLDNLPAFGMDVIVGHAVTTETPVFIEDMREVTFRPYWNVPSSILRREVLPKLARDPDYLRRENMELVPADARGPRAVGTSGDALTALRAGAARVRQRPGSHNSLGLIKFSFPNQDDVYMHGTPAQALFARSRRDFSHGCIRVADPVKLAEWVLKDNDEWTPERIRTATQGDDTTHVRLRRPVTVILFYTTAAVMPEDGSIRFADDIYRLDAKLERALASRHEVRHGG